MKLSKSALSLAASALFACGPIFAQGTGSADSAKSAADRTAESSSAAGGASAQSPLEQRGDRDSERNWSWLGLLGLLGLAGFLRRRRADVDHSATGKRRVAIYDDK
jgi:LPXTG-motif cell wall-anchored protein